MSVNTCLKAARKLLSTGWAEPFSIDERGAAGVTVATAEKCCVTDAVFWSSSDDDEALAALEALEAMACPNAHAFNLISQRPQLDRAHLEAWIHFAKHYDGSLTEWLDQPGRTLDQVLQLFARALVRTLPGLRTS